MKETIRKALNGGPFLLGFSYRRVQRWVEPHAFGMQHNGNEAMCAWQVSGGSGDGYRLYLLNEISELVIGDRFDGPRPGYQRGDQRFSAIFAEL